MENKTCSKPPSSFHLLLVDFPRLTPQRLARRTPAAFTTKPGEAGSLQHPAGSQQQTGLGALTTSMFLFHQHFWEFINVYNMKMCWRSGKKTPGWMVESFFDGSELPHKRIRKTYFQQIVVG